MLLASALIGDDSSHAVHGPVIDDHLVDVSTRWPTPAALVAASVDPRARAEIEAAAPDAPTYPIAGVTWLPPVSSGRIRCIGVNYQDHAVETGRSADRPERPTVFTRFPSSIVGAGRALVRPRASEQFDYEGELAVVIGADARSLRPAEAMAVIAGYACFMDGSVRDFQRHTTQFTPGKNFDRSGSFGPWIVTADEVGDPSGRAITTTVNGEVLQQANTSELVHDVAELVAYCSTFTMLRCGDVIATGTPGGVGAARTPPRWLVPGDEVAVHVEGIGELRNPVIGEDGV